MNFRIKGLVLGLALTLSAPAFAQDAWTATYFMAAVDAQNPAVEHEPMIFEIGSNGKARAILIVQDLKLLSGSYTLNDNTLTLTLDHSELFGMDTENNITEYPQTLAAIAPHVVIFHIETARFDSRGDYEDLLHHDQADGNARAAIVDYVYSPDEKDVHQARLIQRYNMDIQAFVQLPR